MGALRLFHARNGRTEEICNNCGRKIQPHALMIARTDGLLFHDEPCARAFSVPSLDTISTDAPT